MKQAFVSRHGANLSRIDGPSYLPPTMILTRDLTDEAGVDHALKIGVVGFLPQQIMVWDRTNLEGRPRPPLALAFGSSARLQAWASQRPDLTRGNTAPDGYVLKRG